jgi:uroporphyrinogen decarboxylase
MKSRERFKMALRHLEPDRVPIDAGQDVHNGIHEIAYGNLLKYLGEKDDIVLYDHMQHLGYVRESILNRLHVDTRYIWAGAPSGFSLKKNSDTSWTDEWGVVRKNFGFYDESIYHPLQGCTMQDVRAIKFPDPVDGGRFEGLKEKAESLFRNTDFALIGANAATLSYLSAELIGFQEYMEKLVLDIDIIEYLIDRILDWMIRFFDRYLDEIGGFIEMTWMGDDWGTQRGPIIDPGLFEKIFVPRYKKFTDFIRSKADVKVALHSCGSVKWAMPLFHEAGIDVLHPLQGDAEEMDNTVEIKDHYGKKLAFYSNIRNQSVLVKGTPGEVEKEVASKMKILAPGGGYIFSGGHNIQADVPPENIIALFDSAFKYGKYPV